MSFIAFDGILNGHKPDANLLPCILPNRNLKNHTWTITKISRTELCNVQWVKSLQRLCFSCHITFSKWVSHHTGEILPLHPQRVLKKVTFPLDNFMTTCRAWRSRRHVTTKKIPLLILCPTSIAVLLWTLKFALRWQQMTLGKYVLANIHSCKWLRKVSRLRRSMEKYDSCSNVGRLHNASSPPLFFSLYFSHRLLETTKPLQDFVHKWNGDVRNSN